MLRAGARDLGEVLGREERAWNYGLGSKLRLTRCTFSHYFCW
jgi:hypothetical protein